MALVRSLSRRTIRVGSYFCPKIFSTGANQNTYDFHRNISYTNGNLNREFRNVRTNTGNNTICARHFHRTITNRTDVGIEDIDQEEVPEKGKTLTVKKYLCMNTKALIMKKCLEHRYLFAFRCWRVVRRCRLQCNGGRAVHLASRRPQPYGDSTRWVC